MSSLTPADLGKTVRIRGEAHSVVEAINRQTSHYAAHVGQIVLLAKHYAGSGLADAQHPARQVEGVRRVEERRTVRVKRSG